MITLQEATIRARIMLDYRYHHKQDIQDEVIEHMVRCHEVYKDLDIDISILDRHSKSKHTQVLC